MKIYKKIKRMILGIIFIFYIMDQFAILTNCKEVNNILILASYDLENEWEEEVINGAKNIFKTDNVYLEFLDFDRATSSEYYEKYYDFLNSKYNDKNIESIYSIDDEALTFIRENMFRKESFMYNKPIFFVGVNDLTQLSEEEKKFISGVLDVENSLETVSMIKNTIKDLDTIYLLLNYSKYCDSLKQNISNMYLSNEGINVEVIQVAYKGELIDKLNKIQNKNPKKAAIMLSGTFSDEKTNKTASSKEIILAIDNTINIPIFSTLENYINEGAIGGFVNSAEKLGEIGANLLERMSDDNNETYFLTPPYNSIYNSVINFKAVRRYRLNPLDFPTNSVFINKPKFDFILPIGFVLCIWSGIIIIIISIIFVFIFAMIKKRDAQKIKLKYIEAKTREQIKIDSLILMSHEFRTPLNIIISTADLLILKSKNNDFNREYINEKLNSIIKNSRRLNRSIDNFIDVVKLDIGVMNVNFEMHNIISVVEDITFSVIDLAYKNNIEIIFDTNEEEVFTAIDKRGIERIMLNLLSNSIKSIENGGSISVVCEKKENFIYITINDDGGGISPESINHIFEKYYQDNKNSLIREKEGSGLGLYIVKGLVELHNGKIKVESELGKGTKFIIEIPIVYVDSNEKESEENLVKKEMSDL